MSEGRLSLALASAFWKTDSRLTSMASNGVSTAFLPSGGSFGRRGSRPVASAPGAAGAEYPAGGQVGIGDQLLSMRAGGS